MASKTKAVPKAKPKAKAASRKKQAAPAPKRVPKLKPAKINIFDRLVASVGLSSEMKILNAYARDGEVTKRLLRLGCTLDVCESNEDHIETLSGLEGIHALVRVDLHKLPPSGMSYDRVFIGEPVSPALVRHALKFLKIGGRVVALVEPELITKAFTREILAARGSIEVVPDAPVSIVVIPGGPA